MFKTTTKTAPVYDDKIKAAKYDCIYKALKDILQIEVKGQSSATNREEINYAQTCSVIKTRARLALDFVANLDKNEDD